MSSADCIAILRSYTDYKTETKAKIQNPVPKKMKRNWMHQRVRLRPQPQHRCPNLPLSLDTYTYMHHLVKHASTQDGYRAVAC
jgi:hypothetical protein